jgi:transcriptional regulator of acetoin/glycerol metabolism
MMLYEWPGNVRELENAIERAVVVGKGRKIGRGDLPIFRTEHLLTSNSDSLKEVEKEHLVRILKQNQWNISKSARILEIDRTTLYSKIKRYGIPKPA